MAVSVITRLTLTDDDGTGTTGTILNNAWLQSIYDEIDQLFSGAGSYTTLTLGGKLRVEGAGITVKGTAAPAVSAASEGVLYYDSTAQRFLRSQNGGAYGILEGAAFALTDGATPALDAAKGSVFTLAASGNRTIAVPSNAVGGQRIVIAHTASGADRTLALNTGAGGFRFGTDITALTATTSGKTDYIGCIYNAADSKWDVVAVTKGF